MSFMASVFSCKRGQGQAASFLGFVLVSENSTIVFTHPPFINRLFGPCGIE